MSTLAFVQPFGIQSEGGGARILRALLETSHPSYLSIRTHPRVPAGSDPHEVCLPVRPSLGPIEGTRFCPPIGYVEYLLYPRFKRRLADVCVAHDVQLLHAIPHGVEFWYAYEVARELEIPYVLNVHDHLTYNMPGFPYMEWILEKLGTAWRGADQRFVISEAMGNAYCQMYGTVPFTTVTDGLETVAPAPLRRSRDAIHMYFMGALHLSYQPNFDALLGGLDKVAERAPDRTVTLTSRGSALNVHSSIPVTNLPWASEAEVAGDLEVVNWLYFPLPFDEEHDDFVRYSLSTKLVTYLGSGLPILYHGPAHSAAAQLLTQHDAAVQVHTPDAEAIADVLLHPPDLEAIVENALGLAHRQFRIDAQKRRFWDGIAHALSPASSGRDPVPSPLSSPVPQ